MEREESGCWVESEGEGGQIKVELGELMDSGKRSHVGGGCMVNSKKVGKRELAGNRARSE